MKRRRGQQLSLPIAEPRGRRGGGLTVGDLAALASPRQQAAELRRRLDASAAERARVRAARSEEPSDGR